MLRVRVAEPVECESIVRGTFMAACSELNLFETSLQQSVPAIGNLLALLNAPDWSKLPGVTNNACPIG